MGTEPFKPWAAGVTDGGFSLGEKVVPKRFLPVDKAKSLAELAEDFAFFTPAVLYLHAGMTDEPLGDFRQQHGFSAEIYHFRFAHQLFRGLHIHDDPDWNFVLWGVRREVWPALRDFYLSIMLLDPVARTASQVAYTEVEVPDSLALLHGVAGAGQLVRVTAFGVDGSEGQLAVVPSSAPTLRPPKLVRLPPSEKMVALAAAYAGRKP